jgi:acyl dehydratase
LEPGSAEPNQVAEFLEPGRQLETRRIPHHAGAKIRAVRTGDIYGPSSWVEVSQERIDAFAEATGDDQWIHVDRERARQGPFGTTIAHGYLTLSLIPAASYEVVPLGGRMGINYGLNRVRFPAPVPAGSRVRTTFRVEKVEEIEGGRQLTMIATVDREGGEKPVCVAEVVFRSYD